MVLVINDVVVKKSPAYQDLYDVTVPGSSASEPIVITDSTETDTRPKERTSRWSNSTGSVASQLKSIYEGAASIGKSSDPQTMTNIRSGGFVKQLSMDQKRKGLQKLLGELPSAKRQRVEDIFRAGVNKRRSTGEMVSEQEEINIYIEALGEIGKKQTLEHKSEEKHNKKRTDKEVPKHKETCNDKNVSKEEQKRTEKEKPRLGQKKTETETENKGKSSCNGKISLEGLNLAEKRLRIQKALDEIPPFVSSKIKSRQKITLTKIKSEGKKVSEVEELDSMAEAFNHMFNEEGNVMAHVLKDQLFKRKGDYRIRRDSAVKQLLLPEFDEQVKRFRKLEQNKQTEEMKTLRESLSVLLKILLFKKQDKVFEGAEKSGVELSKVEKNIIRYQILLDMTQAVVTKREEKEKKDDIATGAYQPEKNGSEEDEFDDDNDVDKRSTGQENETKSQKRPLEETVEECSSPKKGKLTEDLGDKTEDGPVEKSTTNAMEADDDDDDVQIVEEIEIASKEKEEEDEVEKLLNIISSDDDGDSDVNIDEYDEANLLEDIKESAAMENDSRVDKDDTGKDNQEIKGVECESKADGQTDSGTPASQELTVDTVTTDKKQIESSESNMPEIGSDAEKLRHATETDSSESMVESTKAQDVNDVERFSGETEKSKEEKEAELETAFRQVLTPAQRRSILGRMTKVKKTKQAAGNELSDAEAADLRYQMIKEMLEKQAKSSQINTPSPTQAHKTS